MSKANSRTKEKDKQMTWDTDRGHMSWVPYGEYEGAPVPSPLYSKIKEVPPDKVKHPEEPNPKGVDLVNSPQHYTEGGIESIVYMKDNMDPVAYKGFLEGSVKKYLHRHRYKGKALEDLKKAQWYLNKLVEETKEDIIVDLQEAGQAYDNFKEHLQKG